MRSTCRILLVACALLTIHTAALAVVLPDESQQTTLTATVSEQANISVPNEILFDVTNVSANTDATGLAVSATTVVLNDGNALRIELKADAANFTPPSGAAVAWAASDVSWDAAAWTGGTGAAGVLSSAAYTKVADSSANASELSSSAVTWTLASKATIDRAGDHTLTSTWKFSSFTPP